MQVFSIITSMTVFVVTLVLFIFVLGLLVFVHELGHYLAALRVGIKVEEFAIGMGPKIWGFRRGHTDYNIRALPIGGYVKLFGEGDYDIKSTDSFGGKKPYQRLFVLIAGVFMNFLLAVVLLYGLGANLDFKYRNAEVPGFNDEYKPWFGQKSQQYFILADVDSDSPLSGKSVTFDTLLKINGEEVAAGDISQKLIDNSGKKATLTLLGYSTSETKDIVVDLPELNKNLLAENGTPLIKIVNINQGSALENKAEAGDVIQEINGQKYTLDNFKELVTDAKGKDATFKLLNPKTGESREVTASLPDTDLPLQIIISPTYSIDSILKTRTGLITFIEFEGWSKAFAGIGQSLNTVQNFFFSMGKLFNRAFATGSAVPVVDNVGGAISLFDILSKITTYFGFWGIIELTILFSLNLAILNILPIPALDGGHVLFTLLEMIFRRPLPAAIYNYLTLGGFIFLMGLMVFITGIDIVKFPAVRSLFCDNGRHVEFVCDLTVRN